MAKSTEWHLIKNFDQTEFGPFDLDTIVEMAKEAKINPLDRFSNDNKKSWLRATQVPELEMDWLVEMPDGFLYGPTNISAIQDFILSGELDGDSKIINTKTSEDFILAECEFYQDCFSSETKNESIDLSSMTREELEASYLDAVSANSEWEIAYNQLKKLFISKVGEAPSLEEAPSS
jgi:hypothetical protein